MKDIYDVETECPCFSCAFPSLFVLMHCGCSPSQIAILNAVADRIVPANEHPGAAEAGAWDYIRMLLDRDLPHRWEELARGLDRLDAVARGSAGISFVGLSSDQQDTLLAAEQQSTEADCRSFFAWLIELVLESYYADPANGGNRDAVSWKMVGYRPGVPGYDGGISKQRNER